MDAVDSPIVPMSVHVRDMTFSMSHVVSRPSSCASLRARQTPQLADGPWGVCEHTMPASLFKRKTCRPLHGQMVIRRGENSNIHDNNPERRKSLVPTAVDSLEACVFVLNGISLCILSKLDPPRSGRPSESLVNVIQYRRCGHRYSMRCGVWRRMLSVLSGGRGVNGECIKIVYCCLSKSRA
jgi:hypothetical protein